MGAFNEPGFLDRALESVVKQSYRPLSVIVADDSGPTSLESTVKSYEHHFPDISWRFERHKLNRGVARNKIWLFSQVDSEFCCFLEHDDEWVDPEFLEACVKIMTESSDVNVCIGNAEFEAENQNGRRPRMYENSLPYLQLNEAWQAIPGPKVAEALLEPVSARSLLKKALGRGNLDSYNASWSSIVFRTAAVWRTGGLVEETLVPLNQEANLDCYSNEESFSFLFRLLADGNAALTGKVVSLRGLPETAFSRALDHPGRHCRNNSEFFVLYSLAQSISESSHEMSRLLERRAMSIGLGRANSHVRRFFGEGFQGVRIVCAARLRGWWLRTVTGFIKTLSVFRALASGRVFLKRVIVFWEHLVAVAGGPTSSSFSRFSALGLVFVFGIPLWFLSFCLRPLIEIRFFPISASRLGHLVLETDVLITHHQTKNPSVVFFCFVAGKTVNADYVRLLRAKLTILPRMIGGSAYIVQQTVVRASRRHWTIDQRNLSSLTAKTKWIEDDFHKPELQKVLSSLDVNPSKRYVCLWVREPEYGEMADPTRDQHFASYRNASLETYRNLCLTLNIQGYEVILMGDLNFAARKLGSKFFADYANSRVRSGRNDLLLTKFCDFAVAGDSGGMALPLLYRKPLALVNLGVGALSLGHGGPSTRVVTLKRLVWAKGGRPVSSSEILRNRIHLFNENRQFEDLGVRHEDNTEHELSDAAVQMVALQKGDSSLQQQKSNELHQAVMRKIVQMGTPAPDFFLPEVWLRNNQQYAE